MRFKFLILTIVFLVLVSCDSSHKEVKPEAIARVGNDYLYRSDIEGLIPENSSKEDSTLIVKTYIERWATQKLLTEVSELNLDSEQKREFVMSKQLLRSGTAVGALVREAQNAESKADLSIN